MVRENLFKVQDNTLRTKSIFFTFTFPRTANFSSEYFYHVRKTSDNRYTYYLLKSKQNKYFKKLLREKLPLPLPLPGSPNEL